MSPAIFEIQERGNRLHRNNTAVPDDESDEKPQTDQQVCRRHDVHLCCGVHFAYKLHHGTYSHIAITTPHTLRGTGLY